MPTRRELLFNLAAAPFAPSLSGNRLAPVSLDPEILEEPQHLSEESANGYRLLLRRNRPVSNRPSPRLIIMPAARQLSRETALEMLQEVTRGTWLVLESGLCFMAREQAVAQIRVLRDVFGLEVQTPLANAGAYVAYTWPLRRLVRDFSMFTPVECSANEKIAGFGGVAACMKRRVGGGGLIFLGSMLGPGLLAEEREAQEVGSALLKTIRHSVINATRVL
jgi:hypothetical protein